MHDATARRDSSATANGQRVVMPRFYWDALRCGNHVLVHDPDTADLASAPGVVELVDTSGHGFDVAVRYSDGLDAGRIVRPGRSATHLDPLRDAADCWRCTDARAS